MPSAANRSWVGSMPDAYDRWLEPVLFHPFAVTWIVLTPEQAEAFGARGG